MINCLFLYGPYHGKFLPVDDSLPDSVAIENFRKQPSCFNLPPKEKVKTIERMPKIRCYVRKDIKVKTKLIDYGIFIVYVEREFRYLDSLDEVILFLNELTTSRGYLRSRDPVLSPTPQLIGV